VSIEELVATGASSQTGAAEAQTLVLPVTEEKVTVEKRTVETGRVEFRKRVHEHTEVVDLPLQVEEVEVERVAINRVIDEAVPIRYEDDTTIIPLLEEILVIEKRLVLREEIHIKKTRREVHNPQEVLLRDEQVEIVRKAGNGHHNRQDATQDQ
jgi:uncharacterized protein (TIGR02271 family)